MPRHEIGDGRGAVARHPLDAHRVQRPRELAGHLPVHSEIDVLAFGELSFHLFESDLDRRDAAAKRPLAFGQGFARPEVFLMELHEVTEPPRPRPLVGAVREQSRAVCHR